MKKWMALLLCCLLCWCAAGAMAEETVTLSLVNGNEIDIYPDGYQEKGKGFVSYTGPYIITGTSKDVDTCLDFYSKPKQSSGTDAESVTYTVTFQGVQIQSNSYCTALRFGNGEGENGKDITLNLINGESSEIEVCGNHPVFSNAGQKNVTVNLHNANGASLTYYSRNSGIDDLYNNNVTLEIEGATVTQANLQDYRVLVDSITDKWKIVRAGTLQYVDRTEPTCTGEGQQAHWKCSGCEMLFEDASGSMVTTSQALTLPAQHDLTHVEYKDPTCTENGNKEYYICNRVGCGGLFFDAQGENPITGDVVIGKLGHKLTLVPEKPATCTEDGHGAYYVCERCPKLFADENATMPLSQPNVISATGHEFGEDWQSDGEKHWHACECGERSGEAEHSFVTVVDRKPGETEPGEQHEECSVCGYRKAAVSIPAVGRIDLPQTGDSSHLLGWAALFGACCAGLWCLRRRG